jgi:hypothetical protein
MKAGTLSQAVAQVAMDKAEEELRSLVRAQPQRVDKQAARLIRMLPRAAEELRKRIRGGNLGLKDPRSIIDGRNVLFGMFGGNVPLRPAPVRDGERPYLIGRVAINRDALLQAAADAAGCVKSGSGDALYAVPAPLILALPLV